MKKTIFLLLFLSLFISCNNAPSTNNDAANNTEQTADTNTSEQVAIAKVIHDFYTWYDVFQKDETRNIIITNDKGKHLVLDAVKMDQYFANIKASGFIGDEFIANEKIILKKCEALWQNEEIGDVPSCMDADRYFCAQDWDIEFWTKAPVSTESLGADHVKATLSGTEGTAPHEQQFELKKENGKWVITSIYCEML